MDTQDKRIGDDWRIPDDLWERMELLLPPPRRRRRRYPGRKPLPLREVADGIFYVLRTGCQWKAVPREFGSGSSLHRYFQHWVEIGVFEDLWRLALEEYDELKGIDWEWQCLDGAMTKAPLGGEKDRAESHGSCQVGHQAVVADGRKRRTFGPRRQRSQYAR
jgi:putative transposase